MYENGDTFGTFLHRPSHCEFDIAGRRGTRIPCLDTQVGRLHRATHSRELTRAIENRGEAASGDVRGPRRPSSHKQAISDFREAGLRVEVAFHRDVGVEGEEIRPKDEVGGARDQPRVEFPEHTGPIHKWERANSDHEAYKRCMQ
jgi:hypothetical protein